MAQAGIHRCIGADGNPVFTDGACTDMQATPAQPGARTPDSDRTAGFDAPAPILCAANLAQLKQGVADAFAIRDANRLAGLMLWGGSGRSAVLANIRSLRALMQRPLVDFGDDASGDSATATSAPTDVSSATRAPGSTATAGTTAVESAAAPATAGELLIRTAADDGSGVAHETRFAVERQSGCLWLREP